MTCHSKVQGPDDSVFQEMLDDLAALVPEPQLANLFAILRANQYSGRVARSLAAGYYATPGEYARGVARHYCVWQPIVYQLCHHPEDPSWSTLYARLHQAARRRLHRAAPYLMGGLEETAADCAADAALRLYHSRYPFDCDFYAWAYAILNTVCRRALTDLGSNQDLLYHCSVSTDALDDSGLPPDASTEGEWLDDLERELDQATLCLSTSNRRNFARLYYFEGKSYPQIAHEMGKSIGALYKLNNDTLADYRRRLA